MMIFVFVCLFVFAMFVLACHSGFLEGYFSMMICMLFVWEKIKVTSELAGWTGPREDKEKQKSGENVVVETRRRREEG